MATRPLRWVTVAASAMLVAFAVLLLAGWEGTETTDVVPVSAGHFSAWPSRWAAPSSRRADSEGRLTDRLVVPDGGAGRLAGR